MTRHPELTALVERLRTERPRPKLRWSELVERARVVRADAAEAELAEQARRVEQDKVGPSPHRHA